MGSEIVVVTISPSVKNRRQDLQRERSFATSAVLSEQASERGEPEILPTPVTTDREAQGVWIDMSATAPASDADLLQRYEKGNSETAFSALVERYQGMVLGAAFRRTGNLELAKEVAQEVFATLARKAQFLTGRASIGGWLHQAAIYQASRTVQSEARRHARQEHFAKEVPTVATPRVGGSADSDQLAAVDEALGFLSGADREVIVLHYFQDLSYPEMASVLGINEAAVRQRVSRALERLGKRLREQGISGNVVMLLLGAVAVQSSIAAPAGLASAALATAAAGGGASVYLLLTALLSQGAIKTAAVLVAVAGMAAVWHETPRQGRQAPENAQVSGALEAERSYASAASGMAKAGSVAAESQSGWAPAASGRANPPGQLPGVAARQTDRQDERSLAAPGSSRAAAPAGSPALAKQGGATVSPAASGKEPVRAEKPHLPGTSGSPEEASGSDLLSDVLPLNPDYRFPGLLGELAELGGLPAVIDELRRVELLPREAAKLYGELLGDVLSLEPAKRILVEGVLEDHYEQLNDLGIAGIRPAEIVDESVRTLREASVGKVIEDVQDIVDDVAPVEGKVIEDVFALAEIPDADRDSVQDNSLLGTVTDVVSVVPKVTGKVKLPIVP